jgi:hypothetical protein
MKFNSLEQEKLTAVGYEESESGISWVREQFRFERLYLIKVSEQKFEGEVVIWDNDTDRNFDYENSKIYNFSSLDDALYALAYNVSCDALYAIGFIGYSQEK